MMCHRGQGDSPHDLWTGLRSGLGGTRLPMETSMIAMIDKVTPCSSQVMHDPPPTVRSMPGREWYNHGSSRKEINEQCS